MAAAAAASEAAKKHPNLSDEDLQEFQEIFNLVDTDRGGSIGTEELARLMDTLGIRPSAAFGAAPVRTVPMNPHGSTSPEELKLMVSEIDENGNGEIDFEEGSDEPQSRFMIKKVFAGNAPDGCIRVKDLEQALQAYGREKLTAEEAKNLVAQIDAWQ
eukprot:Skav223830  [mRNA]  locus=scaffold1256:39800:45640:- [translate_table: standard]